MHERREFLATLGAGAASLALGGLFSRPVRADDRKPHILLILADDLGWHGVGWHGSAAQTPHLDALAASGVKLERFYVQPVCTPTRACLMTGRYPMRQGLQVGVIKPEAQYGLPLNERTLAEGLKAAGYRTAITGKWHLGHVEKAYLPNARGFDLQYGNYFGMIDYYTHRRGTRLDWHRNGEPVEEEGYATELLAREAVKVVADHDAARPLFLYVPFTAVHAPMQAPERYLEAYAHIKQNDRRKYAAMTACLDDAVGKILAALDQKGMRGETLVVFVSDNGGPTKLGADNTPLRGAKNTLYEGGLRVPACASWPGKIAPGSQVQELMHAVDLYPTLLKLGGGSLDQPLALDGLDVWPALAEGKPSPRTELLHNSEPTRAALRCGPWKLVMRKEHQKPVYELFDVLADPGEKEDLAARQPEKVKELAARLDEYERQAIPPKGKQGEE